MTFGEIVRTDLSILGMGARAHSELASNNPKAISECLARDDWTCCICRTRIPGFMEVDHVQSHGPCQADQLRTICQFCHNLRHPLWAALRADSEFSGRRIGTVMDKPDRLARAVRFKKPQRRRNRFRFERGGAADFQRCIKTGNCAGRHTWRFGCTRILGSVVHCEITNGRG